MKNGFSFLIFFFAKSKTIAQKIENFAKVWKPQFTKNK
jgi:hypothetical protein